MKQDPRDVIAQLLRDIAGDIANDPLAQTGLLVDAMRSLSGASGLLYQAALDRGYALERQQRQQSEAAKAAQ